MNKSFIGMVIVMALAACSRQTPVEHADWEAKKSSEPVGVYGKKIGSSGYNRVDRIHDAERNVDCYTSQRGGIFCFKN